MTVTIYTIQNFIQGGGGGGGEYVDAYKRQCPLDFNECCNNYMLPIVAVGAIMTFKFPGGGGGRIPVPPPWYETLTYMSHKAYY